MRKIGYGPAQIKSIRYIYTILLFLGIPYFIKAQSKITIKENQTTVLDIIIKIQKQSDFTFTYAAGELKKMKVANYNVANVSVKQALQKLKELASIDFSIYDRNISIKALRDNPVPSKEPTKIYTFRGIVNYSENKDPVDDAYILLKDKRGKSIGQKLTNKDGGFFFTAYDSIVTLEISKTGYQKQEQTIIADSLLKVEIVAGNQSLSEVVVSVAARRLQNDQASILLARKNASIVMDGISAELIEKTASITTTQALQRVTGVTITDDKYVAVRGLGDRSVIGQLNGIRLASSDPDRSSIPLDLVPANLLDNIQVYKTITPDMPADASGGIVELKTRSIPSKPILSISMQAGSNSNIGVGGQVNGFYNSQMGFLGQKINDKNLQKDFIELGKQYSGGLADIQKFIAGANYNQEKMAEVNRINKIMHHFDPVLTTQYQRAKIDGIYSIAYGNSFKLFTEHRLGIIASASYYSRSTDISGGMLNQYSIYEGIVTGSPYIQQARHIPPYITPNTPALGRYVSYKENTGTQVLNYGFLLGLSYRFSKNHEISMQYLGSRGGETNATSLLGQYQYTSGFSGPIYNSTYALKQTYRVFNTYNLQGEHKFGSGKNAIQLSYNAASSEASHNNPDYRFVNIAEYRPEGGGFYPIPNSAQYGTPEYIGTYAHYSLVSGYVRGYGPYGLIQADPSGRRFRNLKETNYNYKVDVTVPFSLLHNQHFFKTGINYLYRDRRFSEYVLSLPGSNFSTYKQFPLYQVNGDLNQLIGFSNVGVKLTNSSTGEGAPLVSGFLYNNLKSPNNYRGFYETNALYGMLDLHIHKKIRLTGGVRFEKTNIQSKVDTSTVFIDPSIAIGGVNAVYVNPVTKYTLGYKPYYSANITYSFKDNINFRLAYNTTLARPEIREMTNVFEFDPFLQALVVGNPLLVNQKARAYDFRWEWFPHKGEVVAVSLFEKQLYNQLEKVFVLNTGGTSTAFPEFPTIAYQNNPNTGQVWGMEMEIVKNLGFLWDPLKNVFIGSNLSLVQSDVLKTKDRLEAARVIDRQSPKNSPLFEQAPYSINAYINYIHPKFGTDLTFSFNMVGERLIQISMDGTPDLYSNPTPILDFVFSQKITKRLLFKGYAKNILNPAFEESYNNPATGGTFYGTRYIRRSFKRGTEYMIGFSYNIF